MSVTFEYRFPMQKPPKVSLRLLEMPVKYFCISPGGGGGEGRGREKVLSFFAYISHLSRKQFKELCFRCLLNSFWCSFSGWNPFWNEIQLKFFRINIYQFVKIWSKAVNVKALWSYSWSISRFLGHFYSSSSHFESSLILPFLHTVRWKTQVRGLCSPARLFDQHNKAWRQNSSEQFQLQLYLYGCKKFDCNGFWYGFQVKPNSPVSFLLNNFDTEVEMSWRQIRMLTWRFWLLTQSVTR